MGPLIEITIVKCLHLSILPHSALGGTAYGVDHGRLSQMLSLPQVLVILLFFYSGPHNFCNYLLLSIVLPTFIYCTTYFHPLYYLLLSIVLPTFIYCTTYFYLCILLF